MEYILAQQFEMDLDDEFIPPNSVMYISRDDSMNCQSTSSAPLKGKIMTADLLIDKLNAQPERYPTPWSTSVSCPWLNPGYFDLVMGHDSIARQTLTCNNHHVNVCRNLTPIKDTLLSAPIEDKYRIKRHSRRKVCKSLLPPNN